MALITLIPHQFNCAIVEQRIVDGYINLNQMADAAGKRIQHWLENQSTIELLAEFELQQNNTDKLAGIPASLSVPAFITIEGRGGGTWAHPDIAIQFAQWCSPKFALQVSRWIREWLTTGQNPIKAASLVIIPELVESNTLPDYKQKRLEARIAILQAFARFQKNFKASLRVAAQKFCQSYRKSVPDWILELYPSLGWQTLCRWIKTAKKQGSEGLVDGYGKRKGRNFFYHNPQLAQYAIQTLATNPEISLSQLHQVICETFPAHPQPSYDVVRRWINARRSAPIPQPMLDSVI